MLDLFKNILTTNKSIFKITNNKSNLYDEFVKKLLKLNKYFSIINKPIKPYITFIYKSVDYFHNYDNIFKFINSKIQETRKMALGLEHGRGHI